MALSVFLLWRNKLFESRWMLWILMLSVPLPYIANTTGWMTAELGRQPWLIYGLLRTIHGASPRVGAGSVWFTLLGFMGMYTVLSILWLFLVYREIERGPRTGKCAARWRNRAGGGLRRRDENEIWYCLVAVMVAMYVLLDGFDLGAGAIHFLVARTSEERRQVIATIGPVRDGNEVWLLAAGGTLYFAFPALYASGFSGFYLPLMIVLWLLILRGSAVEFRNHIQSPIWIPFWVLSFACPACCWRFSSAPHLPVPCGIFGIPPVVGLLDRWHHRKKDDHV